MHRLYRDPVAPAGMRNYRHGQHTWSNGIPTQQEREAIWNKLLDMQGHRCAYCEGRLTVNQRHIEHFRQRDRFPQGTFRWDNLFGSCNRKDSCGDLKDRCGVYDPSDLIKPDVDEPEEFLVFDAEGGCSPRNNLDAHDRHRALETIRILGLNNALQQIRYAELQGYVQTAEQFAEWAANFPQEEWLPLLREELDNIAKLPYSTAIRHVLTNQAAAPG